MPCAWISLTIHAVLMVALCMLFPLLSKLYVEPLLTSMFGSSVSVLPQSILIILVIIILVIFLVPLIAYRYTRSIRTNEKLSYMHGVNEGDNQRFTDSMGNPKELVLSNWYIKNYFGQRKLMMPSSIIAAAVLIVMLAVIIGGSVL